MRDAGEQPNIDSVSAASFACLTGRGDGVASATAGGGSSSGEHNYRGHVVVDETAWGGAGAGAATANEATGRPWETSPLWRYRCGQDRWGGAEAESAAADEPTRPPRRSWPPRTLWGVSLRIRPRGEAGTGSAAADEPTRLPRRLSIPWTWLEEQQWGCGTSVGDVAAHDAAGT